MHDLPIKCVTLHGGKLYPGSDRRDFVDPVPLKGGNGGLSAQQFLLAFRIPARSKGVIRKQLHRLGIHVAAWFPELDKQAEFIADLWACDPDASNSPGTALADSRGERIPRS